MSGEKSSEQIPPVVSVTDVAVPGLNRETGFRSGEMIQDWYVDGSVAGKIQSGRNLTYIKIFNASHMVPFDLPMVGQAMIHQFCVFQDPRSNTVRRKLLRTQKKVVMISHGVLITRPVSLCWCFVSLVLYSLDFSFGGTERLHMNYTIAILPIRMTKPSLYTTVTRDLEVCITKTSWMIMRLDA